MIENIDSQNERKRRFGKSLAERLDRLKENQNRKNDKENVEFIEHKGNEIKNYNDCM